MSEILEGLNKEQKEAVSHKEGPLLIVAGAGTGKTTVITRRIAHLIEQGVKSEEILAMAFGDKAALEMEERVDMLLPLGYHNLQISTFHAFGEKLLKEYGLAIGLPDFKVLDEVGQWRLIRNNLEKFELDYYRPLGNPTRFIRALTSHFSRCKDEMISPEEYLEYAQKIALSFDRAEAGNLTPTLSDGGEGVDAGRVMEVANAYHIYQRLLLQNNALDFCDLINYGVQLFKKRPAILQKLQEQYKYILIDEFQDTNLAQYELIKLLAAPRNNLTVVGDDDQSIFKFRGASISNILHFQRDYPNAKFISLTENYRSGQKILDKSYEFIRQNDPDRLEVKLGIEKKLKGQNTGGKIQVLETADYIAEAKAVADEIMRLMGSSTGSGTKITWNDFAVLARSHDALEPFVTELESRGIPHIYFASRGLYRKPIVLDLLAYLRLLDNYHESAALYRVLKFPMWKINDAAIIELSHLAKRKTISLFEALSNLSLNPSPLLGEGGRRLIQMLGKHTKLARDKTVFEVFVQVIADLEFAKKVNTESPEQYQNAKYLEGIQKKIQTFQNESPDKSLKTFMEEMAFEREAGEQGRLEYDPEAGPEAVKLITAHGAKGLEFGSVFIAGLVDKRFPSIERREQIEIPAGLVKDILPEGDAHLEEERRLMYVAMTRAKERLYLTRARDYGGKTTKKPSRFLVELEFAKEEEGRATGKVEWAKGVERVREEGVALPVPKYFSFSQISLFKKCPLEYKYRYILKLPEPGSASLSFGSTIHLTFERFLKSQMQSRQGDLFGAAAMSRKPTLEALQKLYEEAWIDEWYDTKAQKQQYREQGKKILKNFLDEVVANPPRPRLLEAPFKLKIAGGWFRGKIDRADESENGLVIIDYKTGARRSIEKVDRQQLLTYQWAAQEFFGEKVADLQYWFLQDKLMKESFIGEDKDIEKLKGEINAVVAEIVATTRINGFYEADLRVSHSCEYRDLETI